MQAGLRYSPVAAFAGIAITVNAFVFVLLRWPLDAARHETIALAACFDLLVTVPAIYYLLVIRHGLKPFSSIWPVVLLGFFRTLFLFPQPAAAKPILLGASEAALIAFVVFRMRRGVNVENPVLRAVAWELALFRYAFAPRATRQEQQWPVLPFTIHRESGFASLLGVAAGASVVEAAGVHLILQRWSPTAAWIVTAVSLYGALWLVALCRTFSARPVLLSDQHLVLRKGLLWSLSIPRVAIDRVERAPLGGLKKHPGYLSITAGCDPKLLITLKHSLTAEGPYGMRRQVTSIGLSVDAGDHFQGLLNRGSVTNS